MPRSMDNALDLDVDLQSGVVPISKAASSLAALLKRSQEHQQPIIVTQKGYPVCVLLPVDLYIALRDLARRGAAQGRRAADEAPPPASEARAPREGPAEIALAVGAIADRATGPTPDGRAGGPAAAPAPAPRQRRGDRRAKQAD